VEGQVAIHELVNPPELAPPRGFTHAVRAGDAIYLAGQTAHGPDGTLTAQSFVDQFELALANLVTALRAAGAVPSDLVSLQAFVTDVPAYRASLPALGQAWRRHFGRHYPAMGLFGVTELVDPAAKVELMGIAVLTR
jgi:enamine deaminase RidA (YjgF/YER057c/UK114 family)